MYTSIFEKIVDGDSYKILLENEDAPLHDLTAIYPDDIYTDGLRFYAHGGEYAKMDREAFKIILRVRNKPNQKVTVYSAVDKNSSKEIDRGDWVTLTREYADIYGYRIQGGYKIVRKEVPAKAVFTDGNSIHDYYYDDTGSIPTPTIIAHKTAKRPKRRKGIVDMALVRI